MGCSAKFLAVVENATPTTNTIINDILEIVVDIRSELFFI
jgi:hypothetical protein